MNPWRTKFGLAVVLSFLFLPAVVLLSYLLSSLLFLYGPPPAGEPRFGGKPLSAWLDELRYAETTQSFLRASNAVRQIGTNALPYLLPILQAPEKRVRQPGIRITERVTDNRPISGGTISITNEMELRLGVASRVLGPAAGPIISQLTNLLHVGSDDEAYKSAEILLYIGPRAFEPLFHALQRPPLVPQHGTRSAIFTGLQNMLLDDEPVGALSELIRLHGIADPEIASLVERLLSEAFGSLLDGDDFGRLFPGLRPSLSGSDFYVKKQILTYARRAGGQALVAVPDIVKLLTDPDVQLRTVATNALLNIDPKIAARMGVKRTW